MHAKNGVLKFFEGKQITDFEKVQAFWKCRNNGKTIMRLKILYLEFGNIIDKFFQKRRNSR